MIRALIYFFKSFSDKEDKVLNGHTFVRLNLLSFRISVFWLFGPDYKINKIHNKNKENHGMLQLLF